MATASGASVRSIYAERKPKKTSQRASVTPLQSNARTASQKSSSSAARATTTRATAARATAARATAARAKKQRATEKQLDSILEATRQAVAQEAPIHVVPPRRSEEASFASEVTDRDVPNRQSQRARTASARTDAQSKSTSKQFKRTDAQSKASSEQSKRTVAATAPANRYQKEAAAIEERLAQSAPSVKETRHEENLSVARRFFQPLGLAMTLTTAVVALVLAVMWVFPVARTYYVNVRSNQQLAAEEQALGARNATIQTEIDNLNTDLGIENQARAQLGWVKADENAVAVIDIGETADTTSLPGEIPAGSVEAPSTWLTKILDVVFHVN